MSDQDDLFTQTKTTDTDDKGTSTTNNLFSDKLKTIVNDKGEPKYKDVEAALEALKHSQDFIETLKREKQTEAERANQLEQELSKRVAVEEAIEKLTKNRSQTTQEDNSQSSQMNAEAIEQLIQASLEKQKQGEVAERNLAQVVSSLKEKFGDKAKERIAEVSKELGVSPADLEKLARQNPKMVLHLMGEETTKTVNNPTKTSMTTTTQTDNKNQPPKFEKSALRGGMTDEERRAVWREFGKYTHERLGVEK